MDHNGLLRTALEEMRECLAHPECKAHKAMEKVLVREPTSLTEADLGSVLREMEKCPGNNESMCRPVYLARYALTLSALKDLP